MSASEALRCVHAFGRWCWRGASSLGMPKALRSQKAVSVDEKHLQETEMALEAAVAEATERRKAEHATIGVGLGRDDCGSPMKLGTKSTKLAHLEATLDKLQEDTDKKIQKLEEKSANATARLTSQLTALGASEAKATRRAQGGKGGVSKSAGCEIGATVCGAVQYRVPAEVQKARAAAHLRCLLSAASQARRAVARDVKGRLERSAAVAALERVSSKKAAERRRVRTRFRRRPTQRSSSSRRLRATLRGGEEMAAAAAVRLPRRRRRRRR